MSQESHSSDLLIHWQEAREKGQDLSAEQLCQHCPELLPEVRRKIARLRCMERLVAQGTSDQPPSASEPARAPDDSQVPGRIPDTEDFPPPTTTTGQFAA